MTRRREKVGLSLLCALAFCAFAAQSASAVGTTAFTCAPASKGAEFSDEHCDTSGSGEGFVHASINAGEKTEVSITNEKTAEGTKAAQPFILSGVLGGIKVKIECKAVTGQGTLTNEEVEKSMQAVGTALIETSKCTIDQPKCTVKEPITWDAQFKTYGNETAMGIEFTPTTGKTVFGSWTLTGPECAIKNTFTISGSFQATPGGTSQGKGATLTITEETSKNLKWGTAPYTLTGAITLRMKDGNPIVFKT